MIAISCTHERLAKHGKDRHGKQRWKCAKCGQTVTRELERPLGDMRLPMDKAVPVLRMLLEGMSIRAASRLTGIDKNTICNLVLNVGENCNRFLGERIKNVEAKFIEMDEIWSFVFCKSRTQERLGHGPDVGDSWTWLAIDADTKLVLSHIVGKRDESTCQTFLKRLNNATTGRCQVTSDGLGLYRYNVPLFLGSRVDFAQLIKTYSHEQVETRYSPATIISAEKTPRFGTPDEDRVSTSYAERLNLSMRMHMRRFTRLTNGHSKKNEHHAAMISLFVAWYNFCRKNEALGKSTPAMAAKLTERVWTLEELLTAAAN